MQLVIEMPTQADIEKRWAESAILCGLEERFEAARRKQEQRTATYDQKISDLRQRAAVLRKEINQREQKCGSMIGAIQTLKRAKSYRRGEMKALRRHITTVKLRIANSVRKEKLLSARRALLRQQITENKRISDNTHIADQHIRTPTPANPTNAPTQRQGVGSLPSPNLDGARAPDHIDQADQSG
jgi:iron-sulfur cluster repair protein YtfE (RIC family)